METPLLILLYCMVWVSVGKKPCPTGKETAGGECCRTCPMGEGVTQPCGVNQTVCESCLDSVTFSDTVSHTDTCKACTECLGNTRMVAPCVETDDAICGCAYGYFQSDETGVCQTCRSCPLGNGMMLSCSMNQDTVCETCMDGTFSDEDNNMDPCLPCTICEDEEIMLEECTSVSDTVCMDPNPRLSSVIPFLTSSEVPTASSAEPGEGYSSVAPGSSEPVRPRGAAENLIPVYCSILAAVIAGLVAFIVFKRWNSCKQNKQGGNNSHPVNQTPSPEGEKLHSDSGISVNSDSTAEQPAGHTQGKNDLFTNLSPHKQEEVEKLLTGSVEQTWRCLAGELGYQDEFIDSFTKEEFPVRALLSDWSNKDSATTDSLYSALRKIQREDIAQSLYSDSTATSPV
ncbi:tumor necrosis factor receptor superfamily member 16 [Ascaphus truei]|uniref:tumor necrosis factor receptor superfamily member 16 n=1 Tax=Ascaphus truei TaxID=8439 RepID=UPI003F5A3F18